MTDEQLLRCLKAQALELDISSLTVDHLEKGGKSYTFQ